MLQHQPSKWTRTGQERTLKYISYAIQATLTHTMSARQLVKRLHVTHGMRQHVNNSPRLLQGRATCNWLFQGRAVCNLSAHL